MAKYRLTDAQTGRAIVVSGDSAPTQDEAESYFAQAGFRGGDKATHRRPEHTGFSSQVERALNGPPIEQPQKKTFRQIGGEYVDLAEGVPTGFAAGLPGLPGDAESIARIPLSITGISKEPYAPTSADLADRVMGPAPNGYVGTGRAIGSALSQGLLVGPLLKGAGALLRSAGGGASRVSEAVTGVPLRNAAKTAEKAVVRSVVSREGGSGPLAQRIQDWRASGASGPSLIDVVGGPTRRLIRGAAASVEGEAENLADQYLARIHANLQDNASWHARNLTPNSGLSAEQYSEQLKTVGQNKTKPLYERAFQQNENITSPVIDEILATPEGQKALRRARIKMANDRAPVGEAGAPLAPEPKGAPAKPMDAAEKSSMYAFIRKHGGIRTHDTKGVLTREGGEVKAALKDNKSRLINNKTGMYPDKMREMLAQHGWFGRAGDSGADIDSFYEAIRADSRHPEAGAASRGYDYSYDRDLSEAQDLASQLGIEYGPKWSSDDIYAAAENAERSAVRTEGAKAGYNLRTLDYVKRSLDDKISAAMRAGKNDDVRIFTGMKEALVKELEAADQSGAYLAGRNMHKDYATRREAIEAGRAGTTAGADDYSASLNALGKKAPGVSAAIPGDAGVGYRQSIIEGIQKPAAGSTGFLNRLSTANDQTANLARTYGPAKGAQFQAAVRNEAARLANARFINPKTGSQTHGRFADEAMVNLANGKLRIWVHIVDAVRGGNVLSPAEKAALVELGTSEAQLRDIVAKIPKQHSRAIVGQILLRSSPAAANATRGR